MQPCFHQLIRTPKQLSRDDDDGGGPVSYFFVLFLCEVNKDFSCGMLDVEKGEDGCTVVGYRDFLYACFSTVNAFYQA